MMTCVDQNSMLSDGQYGFRNRRSADLAILTLTEDLRIMLKWMNL